MTTNKSFDSRRYKLKKKITTKLYEKIKYLINKILSLFNLKIIKILSSIDEKNSFIENKDIQNIKINLLSKEIKKFFSGLNINMSNSFLRKNIIEFEKFFYSYNYNKTGGFGYNNAIFLFLFCKKINPEIIWESGVFKGFTTLIIDKSTNSNSRIFCHDVSFKNINYKSKKATYLEEDIETNFNPVLAKKKSIFFFDDHVSHLKRFKFIVKNNIKYNLFDDDVSITSIISDGEPPLPSLNIIKNNYNLFNNGKINWSYEGLKRSLKLNKNSINYNNLMKNYRYSQIPNLSGITGYKRFSPFSFLIKKN